MKRKKDTIQSKNKTNSKNDTCHIYFCKKRQKGSYSYSPKIHQIPSNFQSLYLLSKSLDFPIFKLMPKTFTISTKNSSNNFNIELLKDSSPVISDYIQENPGNNTYFLNINDEENVLQKFADLYQGISIIFNEDELPTSQRITKLLQIKNCPNYLKPESLRCSEYDLAGNTIYSSNTDLNSGVEINKIWFEKYLENEEIQTFTITTNKREYKCNIFGIYSSNLIREILEKNEKIKNFVYDFKDEFEEFQLICDLFNFKRINITNKNMESLKKIAYDLKIELIIEKVENYIENYQNFSKKIDEQQTIIESINQLFDWLYNIQKYTVQFVKDSIVHSKWIENEENVQELAAFILQVVKTDFHLHKNIVDLLLQLNEEANESNSLNILLPFIIKKLVTFYLPNLRTIKPTEDFEGIINDRFDYSTIQAPEMNSKYINQFIFILYKKGIFPKEEITKRLKDINIQNKNFISFFLPEIIEYDKKNLDLLMKNFDANISSCLQLLNKPFYSFMNKYLPDKIDLYKNMLDKLEPDDELTKTIQNDDVDTLQFIINRDNIHIQNGLIPYNIFDDFLFDTNLINYAALYGSVKCFKYLYLNEVKIDEITFKNAIQSGNTEIIEIVDKEFSKLEKEQEKSINKKNSNNNPYITIINQSISMHKNELFDWLFEQKFGGQNGIDLSKIAMNSAMNGNAHSLIKIIDNGFDLTSNNSTELINELSKNGFYKLLQLIISIINEKVENSDSKHCYFDYTSSTYFGNLSIFKLFIDHISNRNIEKAIKFAIENDYNKIVNYFFDNIINNGFVLKKRFISMALIASFTKKTDDYFNFLFEKFKGLYNKPLNIQFYSVLLTEACGSENASAAKTLIEIIINKDSKFDFSTAFIRASSCGSKDICKYLMEKKVKINYDLFSYHSFNLGSIDHEFFSIVMNNANPSTRNNLLSSINQAIRRKNKDLVDYLLKENAPSSSALFEAVSTHDYEIVDVVLKYRSEPYFINKMKPEGTALMNAVKFNDIKIVKRLLSVPGIDPSLYNQYKEYPLTMAIKNKCYEIVDELLKFFGDDFQSNYWMFSSAFYSLSKQINNGLSSDDKYWKIVKRFFQLKSIDPNFCDQSTFLYKACSNGKIEIVEHLLKLDKIDVNKISFQTGATPLITAITQKYSEIAKLLIKNPNIDINYKNSIDNETALTASVRTNQIEIVDLLINNEKFNPKESCLNYSFNISDGEIAKLLASLKSLNINYSYDHHKKQLKDYCHQMILKQDNEISCIKTTLIHAVELNDIEKVDLIVNHQLFDKDASKIIEAIFVSAQKNNALIFKKLMKFVNDDINIKNNENKTLLLTAAKFSSCEILKEIFNNPNFDAKNPEILMAFVNSYNDPPAPEIKPQILEYNTFYNEPKQQQQPQKSSPPKNTIIETMNLIYDYDKEHEHLIDFQKLLPDGKSFFTSISHNFESIEKVSDFLLVHDVDPNKPDENGNYPLENAILINSLKFVSSLVNSNKVDFNQRIKGKTYLHLAASTFDSSILKIFLDHNWIDINSKDDEGNTALIDAIKSKYITNVDLLFNNDKIDYLHCFKNGKDVLNFHHIQNPNKTGFDKKSKDDYYKELIFLLNDPDNYDADNFTDQVGFDIDENEEDESDLSF